MKKTLILVADPEIPRTIPGDGMHLPPGTPLTGVKPAILKVRQVRRSEDTQIRSAIILKEGLGRSSGSPLASLAVNRDLPVVPSVQAIRRAKPNAAIPGRQNGRKRHH